MKAVEPILECNASLFTSEIKCVQQSYILVKLIEPAFIEVIERCKREVSRFV